MIKFIRKLSFVGVNPFCGPERNTTSQKVAAFTRLVTFLAAHVKKNVIPVLSVFVSIDLFTDTAATLKLLDFRSNMGCPGGKSLSIYARFSVKKRTSMYISLQKGDHYLIQTRHNNLFFPLQSFSRKT